MVEKDKVITRTCGRLAVVQSAMPGGVVVQPNQSVIIPGVVRKGIRHKGSLAMFQPTSRSPLSKGAEISPVVKTYEGDGMLMNIQIANLSRNAFRIEPHETLCELQHVEIEDPAVASEE